MTGLVVRFGSLPLGTTFRFLSGTTDFVKVATWRAFPRFPDAGRTRLSEASYVDARAWVTVAPGTALRPFPTGRA